MREIVSSYVRLAHNYKFELYFMQGAQVVTLSRQNESDLACEWLALTSIFGLCFMHVCLIKSYCYSLIYSSLVTWNQIWTQNFYTLYSFSSIILNTQNIMHCFTSFHSKFQNTTAWVLDFRSQICVHDPPKCISV